MKSKSLILMFVSLGFGLIAAIGIGQVMGKGGDKGEAAPEMAPVLVAIDLVDMHTSLSEENVKIDHWPASIVPEEAVTSLEELEGMVNTVRLSKGAPILRTGMDHRQNVVGTVVIPEGFKVCAIKVSGDDTINGLLAPGHRIDVIGVFKTRQDGESVSVSKTFLKNVQVYSVNASFSNKGQQREEVASSKSAIVGLLLNERNSEQLVLVQKVAQLKLVLRGESSSEDDTDLANIDEELEQYINSRGQSKGNSSSDGDSWSAPARGDEYKQIVYHGSDKTEYSHGADGSVTNSAGEVVPFSGANPNDSNDGSGRRDFDSDLEEDEYLDE